MAHGDIEHDKALKAAWHSFCEDLKNSADDLFRDPIRPGSANERAEAFRCLTLAVTQGLAWHAENETMGAAPAPASSYR